MLETPSRAEEPVVRGVYIRLILTRRREKKSFLGVQEVIKTKAVGKMLWVHAFRSDIH